MARRSTWSMGRMGKLQRRDWLAYGNIRMVKLGSCQQPSHSISRLAIMGIATRLGTRRRSRSLRNQHRPLVIRRQRMVCLVCRQHHHRLAHCTFSMGIFHICTFTAHGIVFVCGVVPG